MTADGRFFLVTAAHLFEGCDPGRFAIASANTTQMWSIGRCNLLIPTDETSASSPCARFVLPLRRRGHPNHWDGDCHTEPQWMQWCVHLGVREPPQGVSFWTPEHCLRVVGVQCASLKGRYFRAKSWGGVLAIMRQTDYRLAALVNGHKAAIASYLMRVGFFGAGAARMKMAYQWKRTNAATRRGAGYDRKVNH